MKDDVIFLVSETYLPDEYGVLQAYEQKRQVFAVIESVSAKDFYSARTAGLMPELKITVFSGDYGGEKTVMADGVYYNVYRTYERADEQTELYTEKANGK